MGAGFATVPPGIEGTDWEPPTLLPALAMGIATVAAPLLVIQPAMASG